MTPVPPIDPQEAVALLMDSPVPIIVHREGLLLFANKAALAAVGADTDVIGSSFFDFIAPEDRHAAMLHQQGLIKSGASVQNVQRLLVDANGRRLLALGSAAPAKWGKRPAVQISFTVLETEAPARRSPTRHKQPVEPIAKVGPIEVLSERERQVAVLVARGMRTDEIATTLEVTEATVRTHLKKVYRKTNAHSRVQLAHLVMGIKTGASKS